jgi:hypothetical protein
MKLRFTRISLLLLLAAVSAPSQTLGDLKSKYGAPQESYEIRPGIFMVVKFAADGHACEMLVEKRHVQASGTINLDQATLSQGEIKDIVNELVPVAARGEKSAHSGIMSITGVGASELEDYENVSISYHSKVVSSSKESVTSGGTAAIIIKWKNKPCKEQG